MELKIVTAPGATIPKKSTPGAAGYDLAAHVTDGEYFTLSPGEVMAVPTGLNIEIPEGHYIAIKPRSGMALKNSITVLNSPATIDSDYTGEIMVILINHGLKKYVINNGDRIAQMSLEKENEFEWKQIEQKEMKKTKRGADGFGSTG